MGEQHVKPKEAVVMCQAIGADRALGMHWGTFELPDESLDQPPKDLAQALVTAGIASNLFRVLGVEEAIPLR
jgi:N-acyl-phosphatidylethanolamine-hydrolysing phospholipase D